MTSVLGVSFCRLFSVAVPFACLLRYDEWAARRQSKVSGHFAFVVSTTNSSTGHWGLFEVKCRDGLPCCVTRLPSDAGRSECSVRTRVGDAACRFACA